MAIVKFDVSGSDPKAAFSGGGKQPTPGVYTVKIKDCKPGFRKQDNGQPDKSAPRLEVIAEIQDKKFKGSVLYDYISFSEASQWKMDQFLQVLGLASGNKRKGSFDTAKVINKKVKVRVVGDTYNGEYRGKLGSYLPDEDLDVEDEADEEAEEEADEEDSAESEEGEEDDLEALGEAADEEDEDAQARLTELAEEEGLDPDDYETWADLAAALAPTEEESEAEEEEEEESEEEEEDEVPPYSEWSLADLKAEIENRGLEPAGTKKAALVAALEEDDEEEPF